jgi:hypothetical protein
MGNPDYLRDDAREVFRQERERKLRESARLEAERNGAEVKLLDGLDSQEEFKARRAAAPGLVVDPDAPLDGCSYRDYKTRREQDLRPTIPEPQFVEGMSMAEYRKWREKDLTR